MIRCRSCDAELTPGARFCAACAAPAPAGPGDPGDPLRTALETALGFQYRVERLLGRGGMGAVYLATELALDREVAIKVLPPERGGDDEGRARFRREARTAARLNHPNVVPLLTFGEVNGLAYYVMGYVRGESLASIMKRDGRLAPEMAARILGDVADALDYAHRQGVVHRDIKPDNVLIEEESGRALLTDFGIARARGGQALTSTGMLVGTPRYMSPEQASASTELDGRSDLYSLGLVGYEMVSGTAPFDGRTPAEQILQRITRDPTPLPAHGADAPAWLTTAIARCLERDPAARWPDGRSLREQLLSGGTETELPAALQNLGLFAQLAGLAGAYGAGLVLWDLATGAMQRWLFYQGHFDPEPEVFALLLVPPLLGLLCLDARRKGHSWSAVGAALVRQPRWWVGFYPRAGRARGDVWDRLPRPLRVARTVMMAFPLVAWYVTLGGAIDSTGLDQYQNLGSWQRLPGFLHARHWDDGRLVLWPLFIYGAALGLAFVSSFRRLRRGPLAGLDRAETWLVFTRSTANARFWARPIYAGLLAPAPGTRPATAVPPAPLAPSSGAAAEGATSTQARPVSGPTRPRP